MLEFILPKTIRYISLSLAVSAIALAGCAVTSTGSTLSTESNPMRVIEYNYAGADAIAFQINKATAAFGPVIVASLANVDKLDSSSTFGRISADEIGSRLAQHGFVVIEARIRGAFVVGPGGDFILSDQFKLIARQQSAKSVLVGTYADSGDVELVSLKLLRIPDGVILGSTDYYVPMNDLTHDALIGANEGARGKTIIVGKVNIQ